jgi:nucleotide-binding universal stress UspA family protein
MDMASARTSGSDDTVVLCYDGSDESVDALAHAGRIVAGWHAVVVCVWKRIIEEALATPLTPPVGDPVDANERERASAQEVVEQGVALAAKAGLDAEGLVVEADGPRWEAIELVVEKRAAAFVVCGTRHSGVTAAIPKTLSGALVAHSSRPVLVVPSARAAAERLREAEEERASRHVVIGKVAKARHR